MGELGRYLVEGREKAGLGLDHVARITCIPLRLLTALEAERYEELPQSVFVRGFVTAYCRAVGLDASRGLDALSAGLRGRSEKPRREPLPVPVAAGSIPVGAGRPGAMNWTYLAILLVFVVGIVVALLTVGSGGRGDVSRAGGTLPGYHRTGSGEVN
jgi:cytoskeletal protein RodZ